MKKTKQLLRSALAVLLVAAVLTAPAMAAASGLEHFTKTKTYAGQFSDVSADSWFYENVAAVYELSLMQGESDTYFNANGNLSIAETIAMAARLHSIYTTGEEDFIQDETCWYQVYIDYALKNGIINAACETPTKAASRAEFAAILSSALPDKAFQAINTVDAGTIPDVSPSASYAQDVYKLYRAGVLAGNDDKGTFAPDGSIKRNAAAAILARIALPELRQSVALESLFSYDGSSRIWINGLTALTFFLEGEGNLTYFLETGTAFHALWSKSWNGSSLTLYLIPNARGTDTVTVCNSVNQEKIAIDVTVTAPQNMCYDEFDGIPDFAKVTGVSQTIKDANNVYLYSSASITGLTNEDYAKYEAFLEGYGFQYISSYRNDFQETLHIYENRESGITLHIGWSDYYAAGGFLVSVIEP